MGFKPWISDVRELAFRYNIELNHEQSTELFKRESAEIIERTFLSEWRNNIKDENKHPILRTYNIYKTRYEMEPYLYLVKNPKYRIAISKIRTSSHKLEIERGRYTRPKTPAENVLHVKLSKMKCILC